MATRTIRKPFVVLNHTTVKLLALYTATSLDWSLPESWLNREID